MTDTTWLETTVRSLLTHPDALLYVRDEQDGSGVYHVAGHYQYVRDCRPLPLRESVLKRDTELVRRVLRDNGWPVSPEVS